MSAIKPPAVYGFINGRPRVARGGGVGGVVGHLGKNLLSDLWDGDVDDMTVDEVKAMNVSLLRRFLRAKNSAVYAADARRRAG